MVELKKNLENKEFNYNDIVILPDRLTDFGFNDVDLTTKFTRNIELKIPLISSPMDTVTEADMAITLASQGGIGVIHYNMSPEKQAKEAEKVKRYKGGFIENPIVLSPNSLISEVVEIKNRLGIDRIPITQDGNPGGKLIGMITRYNYSSKDYDLKVRERMTYLKRIHPVKWSELEKHENPLQKAHEILLKRCSPLIPIVDDKGNLLYIVTKTDIDKSELYPNSTKDIENKLMVAVAIESRLEEAMKRVEATHKFANAYVIDTSHGFVTFVADIIKEIHKKYKKDVIVGNVSTANATQFLIESGADAIRVGTGPGHACTTIQNIGVGRLQGSAVYECAERAKSLESKHGYVPVIADGGIRELGDFLKALALGADTAMVGYMLAGTKESPGDLEKDDSRLVKKYRGMGSDEAMKAGSSIRYGVGLSAKVSEGIVERIEYRGEASELILTYIEALKRGMQKSGCRTIKELHEHAAIAPRKFAIN